MKSRGLFLSLLVLAACESTPASVPDPDAVAPGAHFIRGSFAQGRQPDGNTVMLDGKTRITRGKDTLDAAALKAGERVSIDYIEENKMMMAQAVKLGAAPVAKTVAKKK